MNTKFPTAKHVRIVWRGALALMVVQAMTWGQQAPIKLRVALGDVEVNKVPFIIALERGIYRRNGLDVEVFTTSGAAEFARRSGIAVPPQHVSDGAPITISGGTPLVVSVATDIRSLDRVILATTDHIVRWHIIAQPEIKQLEQLKGKRIGFSGVGAMTHYITLNLCKRMGWDPEQDVSLMAGALVVEVLQNRTVDAIIADDVHGTMARAAGFQPLLDLRTWNLPIAGSGVLTTRSWVKDNPEAARRFIKSTVEAIAVFKKDPTAAYEAMAHWWNITDPEKQKEIYVAAKEMPRKPYPALEGIKKTMEIYDSHEMRKHKPQDFYDDSFVRELDDSGFIDKLYE
jgi:NitT/TauT family transport system substrate-binding protein